MRETTVERISFFMEYLTLHVFYTRIYDTVGGELDKWIYLKMGVYSVKTW